MYSLIVYTDVNGLICQKFGFLPQPVARRIPHTFVSSGDDYDAPSCGTPHRTLILSLLVGPLAVAAQPSAHVPRIGLLSVLSPALREVKAESFRQGLRELGYVEGQNVSSSLGGRGRREQLAELAADLVRLGVAVIVTESTVSALAAKQATDTIPIVMATSGNPMVEAWWQASPAGEPCWAHDVHLGLSDTAATPAGWPPRPAWWRSSSMRRTPPMWTLGRRPRLWRTSSGSSCRPSRCAPRPTSTERLRPWLPAYNPHHAPGRHAPG